MKKFLLAAFAATTTLVFAWQGSAHAQSNIGTESGSKAYAGDVNWLALPTGTIVFQEYVGYIHANEYDTTSRNVFGLLTGGQTHIPSTLRLNTSTTSLSYYSSLFGQPLVFEGSANYENARVVNVGNLPAPLGGLGPQTISDGWTNPVLDVKYGLIADPRNERFLGFTNYFYLKSAHYDNFMQFNAATPHQFTWVPELAYAEGLGKFNPAFRNWWIDVIGNASVHSKGDSPLALAPGVQFDTFTQSTSYDVKAFIRYEYMPLGHVALGIEKSWGGNQLATGGVLQVIFGGPTTFGDNNFTKAHFQFAIPLPSDFQIAADISRDLQREQGYRENFAAELRLTKMFVSQQPAPAFPTK